MIAPILLVALAAAPVIPSSSVSPNSGPQLRVAVPGLNGVDVAPEMLAFYAEHLGQTLRSAGAAVITSRDISTLLGLEREKQLLGCGEDSQNCMAELAQALRADVVVVGDVAKLGERFQVNVKLLSPSRADAVASHAARVASAEAVADELAGASGALARTAALQLGRSLQPLQADVVARPSARRWSWIPMAAGVALAAGGGVALSQAGSRYELLTTQSPITEPQARSLRDQGKTLQTLGWIGVGTGVAAIAAGAGMWLFAPDVEAGSIALVPVANGLGVAGVLP